MDFEEMICEFGENHPILTWLLARLTICVCISTILVIGVCTFILIFVPFVLVSNGAGYGVFAIWLLIPLFATAIWALIAVSAYVFCGVIQ